MSMKSKKPAEKIKIYVPRKEQIKRIQQQISAMNRVLTALWWKTGTKSSFLPRFRFLCYLSGLHYMGSYYNGSEWAQRKLRDLEKLFSKRDSDNRDAQDKSQEEVAKSQQPPAYKKPDDVQKERNRFPFVTDFLAERVQRDTGQLEALQSDRNADNGDAPQAAGKKPSKSTDESAEDDPENITD